MVDIEEGIRRATLPLPFGLDHVHCYFIRLSSGGWMLVDTGLGTRKPEERWGPLLAELDAPVELIVVTHMHPDHVGGSRDVSTLTGAPVVQGREDYGQCVNAWGERDPRRFLDYWIANGVPEHQADDLLQDSERLASAIHWTRDPQLIDDGDELDGWRVQVLRGHADGHIVLERDGILIAGDVILSGITPTIGLYPRSRPDPLGDYFDTLDRLTEMAARVAYTGHKDPVRDPAGRASEIRTHHLERLEETSAALDGQARTAYEVSLQLFPGDLSPALRRFATAEALAHLERLRQEGRIERAERGYVA